MKIRIYSSSEDKEKVIWIPTGFLFTRAGMYLAAKMCSAQARKDYNKALEAAWRAGNDQELPEGMMDFDDVRRAEKLKPPITEEQARELFAALRDSRYLMHGLPLVSVDSPDGMRVRVDL